jgi:NADP-dependent 3-hydroxy acid dehydrogenase YdfG
VSATAFAATDPRRKVFITGASSSLGQALARRYAAEGAILGLVARRADALAALAARCTVQPVRTYAADVRDAAALAAAAQDFIRAFGAPDVVIASAGVSVGSLTGHGDLEAFWTVMDTNYYGMVATFEPFIGPMTAAGAGTLAGVASVAGVRGLPGAAAYSASKAAAMRYLESLRVELRGSGVRVVTLSPGYIRTPMTAHNPYCMPFLTDADAFAARASHVIARQRRHAVIPWQMGIVSILLHLMPRPLYDILFANAPRKPRAPH